MGVSYGQGVMPSLSPQQWNGVSLVFKDLNIVFLSRCDVITFLKTLELDN